MINKFYFDFVYFLLLQKIKKNNYFFIKILFKIQKIYKMSLASSKLRERKNT